MTSRQPPGPYDQRVEQTHAAPPPTPPAGWSVVPVPVATPSPEASHHVTWATDEDYVRRTVRAMFWRLMFPSSAVGAVLVGGLVVLLDRSKVAPMTAVVGLVLVGSLVVVPRTLARRMRKQLPVGSRLELALEPEHLFFAGPPGAMHLRYDAFGRVRCIGRERRVVQVRQGSSWLFLPRELLPGDAVDQLDRRIRAARV